MKQTMIAMLVAASVTACGGASTTTSPTSQTVHDASDPYTHAPASGAPTTSLSGMVMFHLTSGTMVTAYAVQPDGSNGELFGSSATSGTGGRFSVQLTKAPSGMVRLLASGGTFLSEVDGTRQAYQSLELVTPYVTTDFNTFVITPVTHIASHVLSYKASQRGFTLATAYTAGGGDLVPQHHPI